MKNRILSLALLALLCLSLVIPALAVDDQEMSISWFTVEEIEGVPTRYVEGLNWLLFSDNSGVDLSTGTMVEYESVVYIRNGFLYVGRHDADGSLKCGIVDSTGTVVLPLEYDFIIANEGMMRIGKNDKYGFFNESNGSAIDPEYDEAGYFSEGLAWVMQLDEVSGTSKIGYINTNGELVIPLEYDAFYGGDRSGYFSDGLAAVMKDEKWGFIDTNGAVKIPLKYDAVGDFSEGMAWVERDGKYGYIDKTGTVVIPLEFELANNFSEGLAVVGNFDVNEDFKRGYIDKTGSIVIPFEYDSADSFSDGLAKVGKRGTDGKTLYGYIDTTGSVVVPLEYKDRLGNFHDGMLWIPMEIEGNTKYGAIDRTGRIVVPAEYDSIGYGWNGMVRVGKSDGNNNFKYGFCNLEGELVIPLEYDAVNFNYDSDFFPDGLEAVAKDGKWGFIDTSGAVVVPFEYDGAWTIINVDSEGTQLCCVKQGDSYGIFENPYYAPKETDEGLLSGAMDVTNEKKDKDSADRVDTESVTIRDDDKGGFPILPVALGVVAVVVIVLVVVLVSKKKKSAPGKPAVPAETATATAVTQSAATGPKFCPECGKPVKPGTKFCPECGYSLTDKD